MYVEAISTPYDTEIIFEDRENLIIQGKFRSEVQSLKYEVSGNRIKLSDASAGSSELYFRVINNRKFAIGYLYPYPAYGTPPPPMIFEKKITTPVLIGKGNLVGREENSKQNLVIKNEAEWESLKTAMNTINNVTDRFIETDIDFSAYQVIAIIDEVKGTGGWTVDITDITEYSDSIVVTIQNIKTGSFTSVMTQPYHIVKIPASDKEIVFKDNTIRQHIPISDLSLPEGCNWQNLKADTVYLINSKTELSAYLSCPIEDIPDIDFDNHSLVLAHGWAINGINDITKILRQISPTEYTLVIKITLDDTMVAPPWYVTFLTSKLPDNTKINFN
jgi:hypothetical protein